MQEALIIVGVTALAFVSTNLDNLFLLMGLVSGSRLRTRDIALGYASAVTVILSLGLIASYAADLVDPTWLRYLGFVPLSMGFWRLRWLIRPAHPEAPPLAAASGVASVFGLMLANGGDSLGVFTSLMSETSELLVVISMATAVAMAALWGSAARWLVDHPALAPRLRGVDRYAVPFLLIAIGVYILSDTSTDTM